MSTEHQNLPSSLPRGFPHSSPADLELCPHRVVKVGALGQEYSFQSNLVKTTQFTLGNFLPRFLMEEFNPKNKIANCYFLLLAGMQCIPQISNTGGYPTTLLPLVMILLVEAAFQIVQDRKRKGADDATNNLLASRYDYSLRRFVNVKQCDISVGDMLQIKCRSIIPADVVLFCCAETSDPPKGQCHVETKSLDGESYLRSRQALNITFSILSDIAMLDVLRGSVIMEHPNTQIESFTGTIDLGKSVGRQMILPENVALRGCIVRSTDWVIGLVVNTGKDTKMAMMSAYNVNAQKISNVERQANLQIQRIITLLLVLAIAASIGATVFNIQYNIGASRYLQLSQNPAQFFFVCLGYFFILHGTVVPVSLYVSMAVARHFQAFFMQQDLEMYCKRDRSAMKVMNMRLNEELGRVTHVLTDKTGTLTSNRMDFRKASINGVSYGLGITEIGLHTWTLQGKQVPEDVLAGERKAQDASVPYVAFYCPRYNREIADLTSPQRRKIQEFFRIISICHEVICERLDGTLQYSPPNPDDGTLVQAASYFGFKFRERRERFLVIENRDKRNGLEEVEVLEILSFSSARRRMSIIVQEPDNGALKIYSKGADAVMLDRLRAGQDQEAVIEASMSDVRKFSVEGLRCLLVCSAVIPRDRFHAWHKQYLEVKSDYHQLEAKKLGKPNSIDELEDMIERDFVLLGVTAVEDKLQRGAAETISELDAAGINVWMVTGDREDCAINVAYGSNLLLPRAYMTHVVINKETTPSAAEIANLLREQIVAFDEELAECGPLTCRPRAMIIDGYTFSLLSTYWAMGAQQQQNGTTNNNNNNTSQPTATEDAVKQLQQFCLRCKTVIGYRFSPANKRDFVSFLHLHLPQAITMAVGDGENDVAMIREAHVGVGIKGEEGLEAVNSSDFGISQFRFLSPLVLKHGQRNYIRMSNLICYMFYKNILLSLSLFWFNFNCAYSGQKLFTEGSLQMYNVFTTSFPIIAYASYDSHISAEMSYRYPQLFRTCLKNEFFSTQRFWSWLFNALTESLILSIVPFYTVDGATSFLEPGTVCMLGIVIVANLKLFFFQSRWHLFHLLLIAASVGLLLASFFTIGSLPFFDFDYYKLFHRLLFNGSVWLTLVLMLTPIIARDVYVAALERSFNFRPFHIAQEIDAGLGDEFSAKDVVPFGTTKDIESPARSVRVSGVSFSSPSPPKTIGLQRSVKVEPSSTVSSKRFSVRPPDSTNESTKDMY